LTEDCAEQSGSAVSAIIVANKAGRPTKYEPEMLDKLLAALADGLTIKQACLACGICENTLATWREKHLELEPRLTEARETARRKALAGIRKAGEDDWRALEAFLRMSFQADYRRDGSNVQVSQTVQAAVVLTEEKRRELQARLARLQSQSPG